MKGKLGSNINPDFKRSSEIDKKRVYILNHIELWTILNDTADLTDENYIITYWNTSSERICRINTSDLSGEYLQKIFKTNYPGIINPEIIKEPIIIGSYENNVIQSTKKELLFYIKQVAQEIKEIFNKLNLSNSETVNSNKFIFTIRSD
jgi:hypothetical protein